ncbi:MAG: mRNA interferase MazF [Actinomycetota bacterium]|nr:mRNA interferase MazF [Actinomycetota bacterium]
MYCKHCRSAPGLLPSFCLSRRLDIVEVSADRFNRSRAGLVFVVPLTTRARGIPTHPPDGGLHETTWARCEDLRSVSTERLMTGPLGTVPAEVLDAIGERLRLLLQL